MDIKLVNNSGYKWERVGNIFYKGIIFYKDKLLSKQDIKKLFANVSHIYMLKKKLEEITGFFSIIIDADNDIFLITDIVRTFPIFYDTNGNISDNAFLFCKNYNGFLEESINEFLCTGFVTGPYTLLKNLYQVQAGEIVVINKETKKIKRQFYHSYVTNEVFKEDYEILKNKFLEILKKIIYRLVKIAKGDYIIIPLSGGFDSRLIAVMLKEYGYDNVICYTYGNAWSYEVRISKKVAKHLGFRWHFVEYNKRLFSEETTKSSWFLNYIFYSNNLVSSPHLQDFFAVRELKKNLLIPKNSIFVPGHTGDFIAGKHILKAKELPNKTNIDKIILKKHYILCKNPDNFLKKRIYEYLSIFTDVNDNFYYSIDENFNLKERQAKFIVNSLRVYEYEGFKHYIPFWDVEIVNFFRNIPLEYKINGKFYNRISMEIFKKNKIDFIPFKYEKFITRILYKLGFDINNLFFLEKQISKTYSIKNYHRLNKTLANFTIKLLREKEYNNEQTIRNCYNLNLS